MKLTAAQILAFRRFHNKRIGKERLHAAAVAMGKEGGKIGGNNRAAVLSPKETFNIAVHAANQRWGNLCPKWCPYC